MVRPRKAKSSRKMMFNFVVGTCKSGACHNVESPKLMGDIDAR